MSYIHKALAKQGGPIVEAGDPLFGEASSVVASEPHPKRPALADKPRSPVILWLMLSTFGLAGILVGAMVHRSRSMAAAPGAPPPKPAMEAVAAPPVEPPAEETSPETEAAPEPEPSDRQARHRAALAASRQNPRRASSTLELSPSRAAEISLGRALEGGLEQAGLLPTPTPEDPNAPSANSAPEIFDVSPAKVAPVKALPLPDPTDELELPPPPIDVMPAPVRMSTSMSAHEVMQKFRVQGIVMMDGVASAIINDDIVEEGAILGGALIKQIDEHRVIVEIDGAEFELSM